MVFLLWNNTIHGKESHEEWKPNMHEMENNYDPPSYRTEVYVYIYTIYKNTYIYLHSCTYIVMRNVNALFVQRSAIKCSVSTKDDVLIIFILLNLCICSHQACGTMRPMEWDLGEYTAGSSCKKDAVKKWLECHLYILHDSLKGYLLLEMKYTLSIKTLVATSTYFCCCSQFSHII
jgi:hypothetical protein